MTLPPVVRVFFAVDLPPPAREKIGRFIENLKQKNRSKAIRWTRPENLHITLQFLAEVRSEHLDKLVAAVREHISGKWQAPGLVLGKPQLFPNPFRPRVIVLDVTPQEDLAVLSGLIGTGIQAAEYAIEDRPFRAHLTLGRIKQPQGVDLRFLTGCMAPDMDEITVKEVVLFRSEPQPDGSRYTVMERIGL